ncbi:glycerophosphodiester phosphodiesterase domain-containing protein 5-like isoform X1 [Chelmon rostratus]|uniref:glycerophosphodiester phosphodiesterase domain-containing protein 5-like isoform X1 n=2 Tax=Chelmon rostratus TaxID=109905 RepID=UPI001BE5CC4C|nr:glycerophosphodiester phosphodiesterase domain-containing protein 5-like isoform X1 [Chelmon rostratus]XP_041808292.1 glycerophosphodiester phosphodiesterase domain-containing protein 5-like isoform X1 [Chelmon rostratus]XP_041808293.1 glycerophosphodiester phosphodiesterase domain-containing protein 5-like isoform X1 [Chelmon rostratus]XP_041808294.1 glycerophosphodiester phosphodiesterase domain-containing protein 5-like isoform X1 [Chelmon rostratus]
MASTLSQLQFGRLRGLRAKVLRRYEHRPFVSCLSGLYGCRWRRYERSCTQPGDCCCNKLEGVSFALLVAAFCLTLVFLYFWGQAKNDYNDFDWFNFGNLGFWFPWSMVLLVIAAGFFTYVTVLMLLAVCLLSEGQKLYLHWSHKIGILVSLTFSIVATAVLSDLWSKEWTTLLLSFQVTAPYLHVGGVLLMTALSWPIALHFFRMRSRVRRGLIMGGYLTVLAGLYLVPLGLYSPCIKEAGTLGPAPALIGHRGAPMLAPENTLMSFEKAVEAGSDGLETDVTISVDGVPFLMHDHTLQRTTNIHEVFPNLTDIPAAMFTWSELQSLNAGAWFLSHNPFGTVGSLGAGGRQQAGAQSVCSLRAFLQLAAHKDKLVIFDLYRPPRGHPYRDTWIQRTLEVIQNESSIHSSQVLWLPSDLRALVQEMDPELQQTSGSRLPLEELQRNHIVKLNLHYSAMSTELISEYAAVNISTNLYVISQPWLYSLAWCSGVQSVTTNAPQLLSTMSSPLFLMSPAEYKLMWILTDLMSLVLIVIIFIFHRWRERGLAFCSGGKITQDNGTYSKFKTEMSDIWSVSSANCQAERTLGLATVSEH